MIKTVVSVDNVEIGLFSNGNITIEVQDIFVGNKDDDTITTLEMLEVVREEGYVPDCEIVSIVKRDIWINKKIRHATKN